MAVTLFIVSIVIFSVTELLPGDVAVMILGLVLFLGVHTLTTQRSLRARLIASTGEGGYKIGYSLVSAVGLALIVWGFAKYRATGWIDVWYPPALS